MLNPQKYRNYSANKARNGLPDGIYNPSVKKLCLSGLKIRFRPERDGLNGSGVFNRISWVNANSEDE